MKTNKLTIRSSILLLLVFLVSLKVSTTYGYWDSEIKAENANSSSIISIGSWIEETWVTEYNLDIWEESDTLNQTIPEDTIFSYTGTLYVVNDGQSYNPEWHGLPGSSSLKWAILSVDLDWIPNSNYRVNSVVVRNDKWYIANYQWNSSNWFVNDPATHSGRYKEWREIEPLPLDYFDYLLGTSMLDYRANPNDVTYK